MRLLFILLKTGITKCLCLNEYTQWLSDIHSGSLTLQNSNEIQIKDVRQFALGGTIDFHGTTDSKLQV